MRFLLLMTLWGSSAFGWEKMCTMEGTPIGPKVTLSRLDLFRQQRNDGKWEYQIYVPVGVGDRCLTGQYPIAKVSVDFFLTKNKIFQSGQHTFYAGNKELKRTFESDNYYECIDADWSWNYDCSF